MNCNGCGKRTDDGSKFCTYCGIANLPVPRHCANGHVMDGADKFCGVCGGLPVAAESSTNRRTITNKTKDKRSQTRLKPKWLSLPLVVILLIAVAVGFFLLASHKTQLQREGQSAQTRLAKFCQPNSESSINYSQSNSDSISRFDIKCHVQGVNFEYVSFTTALDRVIESGNLIGDGSTYPNGIAPVLSGENWIAFTSGNLQTESGFSNPLEYAENFLRGQISYFEIVDGNPESYASLSSAALPVCSQNLKSWVSNTADDALAEVTNDDWVTQFGANSMIGIWIQDEIGTYARATVDDGQASANKELEVAANSLCSTGTASQDLAIPKFW
jgi:hypothetical protein